MQSYPQIDHRLLIEIKGWRIQTAVSWRIAGSEPIPEPCGMHQRVQRHIVGYSPNAMHLEPRLGVNIRPPQRDISGGKSTGSHIRTYAGRTTALDKITAPIGKYETG